MRIQDFRFGNMRINGKNYSRDLKIVNDSVKPDWRRKSGHLVSLQDLEDIIEAAPEIVVIGKGSPGQMKMDSNLAEEMEKRGIRVIEKPTAEAADEFNRLREENRKVAAGFHLTC